MFKNKIRIRTAIWIILFGALAVGTALRPDRFADAVSYIWGVFDRIIAGFCIAFILNLIMVPVEKLVRRILVRPKSRHGLHALCRTVSIVLTLMITLGALSLVVVSAKNCIASIAKTLETEFSDTLARVPDFLKNFAGHLGIGQADIENLAEFLNSLSGKLVEYLEGSIRFSLPFVFNLTTGIVGAVIDVLLVTAVSIYVLSTKEKLHTACERLTEAYLKSRPRQIFDDLRKLMFDKFSEFFRGQILEALILGILCFVGMLIFRFPHAGDISVLVGVSAIVPVAGPWIGSITSILLELASDPLTGLLYAIFILILQQVEDNVIYPRIVGTSMGVPGLLVLCAVIIGGEISGMLGIILAVPLSAVLYELIRRNVNRRLTKSEDQQNADTD